MPFKPISGESKSVTEEMGAPWTETKLSTILSHYPLDSIFNAYGLLCQCLPNKTLHFKRDKYSRGNHSKVCLIRLVVGNTFGERLYMFAIGKAQKARCFKCIKHLSCQYHVQCKIWMSAEHFEDWVRELDRKFDLAKRKITSIIDNCTVHPRVENLEWIELIFLPPDNTSHTQPMSQDVMLVSKAKYCSLTIRKLISALEKKEPIPTRSILSVMIMLTESWYVFPNKVITNWFKIAGISEKEEEKVRDEEDDPFADLNDIEKNTVQTFGADLDFLKRKLGAQVDLNITPNEFIDLDIEVAPTRGRLSIQEILADINSDQVEVSDNKTTKVLKVNLSPHQELKNQQKLLKLLRILAFFQNF